MAFKIGENVGPYRIIEQLGRGGMATVYKAYHAKLDRYVALKVLHPAFLEDENFLARFQREARLVAKIEHPNIVPIYDFAEHEGQPYLVMKFVEGETLKAYLNRGRLSVEQIWDVVEAVGAGLGYAHEQGILHRDIKPSNVIVADDGQMYLADFGLARIAEMGESTLSGDMIMGTPQYISPEQAMGAKDLDDGTDIYSFAVILYEMVVGQVPFSADTPFSIIHDHIYSPLPLPKTVNPSVPDEVERVLLKALAKERGDRHESVGDLVKAFRDAWDQADVDMAEVTMTKPITEVATRIAAVAPAVTAPDPKPVSAAGVSGTSPTDTADPASTGADPVSPPPKKKRKVWKWIGGIALGLFVCFIGLAILSNISERRKQNAENVRQENPLPPEEAAAELENLRAWVNDEPDNPDAHLALALTLFDTDKRQPAYDQIQVALDLAGDNVDFYYDAGFSLMEREVWVGSAFVFLRALQNLSPNTPEIPELMDLFHESMYKAAAYPELFNFVPYDEAAEVDEPMARLADARYTFYHGNAEDAKNMLEDLNRFKPDMPEARLLFAEFNVRDGDRAEARRVYESLTRNENIPAWIVFMAEDALDNMP